MDKKIIGVGIVLILTILSTCGCISETTSLYTVRGELYNSEIVDNKYILIFNGTTSNRKNAGDWFFLDDFIYEFENISDDINISKFVGHHIELYYKTYSTNSRVKFLEYMDYTLYDYKVNPRCGRTIVFARNGGILFDCSKTRFIQLREIDYLNTSVLCSGFTVFYNDANTTIQEQHLSFLYIADNCVPIGQIDKFSFAEYVESVGGWKVKP